MTTSDETEVPQVDEFSVGNIGNYYGGLSAYSDGSRCWWSIENNGGHQWEEIPAYLFLALQRYENER